MAIRGATKVPPAPLIGTKVVAVLVAVAVVVLVAVDVAVLVTVVTDGLAAEYATYAPAATITTTTTTAIAATEVLTPFLFRFIFESRGMAEADMYLTERIYCDNLFLLGIYLNTCTVATLRNPLGFDGSLSRTTPAAVDGNSKESYSAL